MVLVLYLKMKQGFNRDLFWKEVYMCSVRSPCFPCFSKFQWYSGEDLCMR